MTGMKTPLMARLGFAVLLAVFTARSAAAVEQIPPLAKGLLATEKLVADGTWGDPALAARFRQMRRAKILIWFDEQLLGDGQAYSRRAGEFAGRWPETIEFVRKKHNSIKYDDNAHADLRVRFHEPDNKEE
jgi:hypothetical protein